MDGLEELDSEKCKGKTNLNISGSYSDLKHQENQIYFPYLRVNKMS